MNHRKTAWVIAMGAGLLAMTVTAQTTYTWTGNASLNWNTTDANWTTNAGATHIAWTDGHIARFESGGTNTLTQDIEAHGLELTGPRTINHDGTQRVLRLGSGGIDMANDSQLNLDGDWCEIRLTADQTWNTRNSSIILVQNANVTPGQIVTDTPGLVLTVDSTGFSSFDVGALQSGFNGLSLSGFEGTLVLNSGRLLGPNAFWHASGVVFDFASNMGPFKTGAALGLPTSIAGLQGGASTYTTPTGKPGWVTIGGSGTYMFNAALGASKVVTMNGSGTQIFTGNLVHTGATTINAGTLRINGTHVNATNYTVNAGGTLGGTGAITFVESALLTVEADGILDPGADADAVGTLSFEGDATLAEGAVYHWDVAGGVGDRVDVDGTLTLPAVATLVVNLHSGELPRAGILMTFASHSGATNLSGWEILGAGSKEAVVLDLEGTRVLLQVPPPGLMTIMR